VICWGGFWAVPLFTADNPISRNQNRGVSAADQLASASFGPASSAGPHSRYGPSWCVFAPPARER
jgi:hypothetical protein